MTNFIPSGAGGGESMAAEANSEKLPGTRPFFSMNIRSCMVSWAWTAPLILSWIVVAVGCALGARCPGDGSAAMAEAVAAEAVSFVGMRYSDSICAACSGVGCGAVASRVAAFLLQPQSAYMHNVTRTKGCFMIEEG